MRKKIAVGLWGLALLVCLGGVALAQEPSAKRFGVGARLSYYEIDDETIAGILKFEPEGTALVEGNFTIFLHRLFSIELAAGYSKTDVDFNLSGFTGDFGEFTQIPILGTARVHLWHPDISRPSGFYFGAGLGYYINDHELSSSFTNVFPSLNVDVDNSFGAHFNAGFEINLVENLALNLDLKYIFLNEADVKLSEPTLGTETGEVDLKGFILGLGIKYYF
jgi:outer membrane protein W